MSNKVKINFENIAASGADALIPNGYDGFDWNNFGAYDPDASVTSGYVPHGGTAVGFNYAANPGSFSSVEQFDFKRGYFSAAWLDGLSITVNGYRNGVLVATETFNADYGQNELVTFDKSFHKLDKVEFASSGGTEHFPGVSGTHISMDDFLLKLHPIALHDPLG